MNQALQQLDARIEKKREHVKAPHIDTFREFLEHHARVKITAGPRAGHYTNYSFVGRESMLEICRVVDEIIGHGEKAPLKDSTLVLAGGAQFGKTVFELNLAAYLTAVRFLSPGVYMPDDKLAADIVDAKFRPDVVDQIPWFAEMAKLGKAVNESGKAVDKKGAFLVTDGERKAVGMFRGLQKVPTSFSLDVVVRDEEDDIPRDKAKYLSGRLTASQLRLQIIVGTQRIHGSGQNKQWEEGSQGVRLIGPVHASISEELILHRADAQCVTVKRITTGFINPEEAWPQICRCAITGIPRQDDPMLTYEGDFKRAGSNETAATYKPDGHFYYAHPETGEELDANFCAWHHRRPERIEMRRWSFRIAQIGTAAIDLSQIVAHWTRAIADSEEMVSFCCDRRAIPKSASQSLTPQIIERARTVEPYDFAQSLGDGTGRFGGLDTGDRCFLFMRERKNAAVKRCFRIDQIALGDLVKRVKALFELYKLDCLLIDERPAVSEARTLAMILNGLDLLDRWPVIDWKNKETFVSLPGGLKWDGRKQQWQNLRCAVVRFSKRQLGDGIEQGAAEFVEDGQQKFVPLIACNRFEAIDAVTREFLTPAENVMEVCETNGKREVRLEPAMRLPRRSPGSPAILETLEAHLLTGSQREKDEKTGELGDYVDKVENHFLLADAYSGLAESVCTTARKSKRAMNAVAVTTGAYQETGL